MADSVEELFEQLASLDLDAAADRLRKMLFARCIERLSHPTCDAMALKIARDVLRDFKRPTGGSTDDTPELPFGSQE